MDAPTYANYGFDDIVNVKANAASGKVSYFPYGVYIIKNTLFIPPGSRIVGEAWPVISGAGSRFKDESNPTPVVKVGNAGQSGIAHISDMRFTVSEVLSGAKIVEVNLSGPPGSVGIWNSIITIGGTAHSSVHSTCTSQDTSSCKAAFFGLHLTASSCTYVQSLWLWLWTADHNLDVGPIQIISTGCGILVEATQATWLVGTGSEHNWLYNYNLHHASNVFAGLQQSESPYLQGSGAVRIAPAPWTANSAYGDPDFSWCGGRDGKMSYRTGAEHRWWTESVSLCLRQLGFLQWAVGRELRPPVRGDVSDKHEPGCAKQATGFVLVRGQYKVHRCDGIGWEGPEADQ
ncbi:hypothetical protein MMC30_008791 [Trapelia coarctata]|nr:hypothetical protein [Trapelia coarctata]